MSFGTAAARATCHLVTAAVDIICRHILGPSGLCACVAVEAEFGVQEEVELFKGGGLWRSDDGPESPLEMRSHFE